MPEMDNSSSKANPPQISQMFQKFAIAFKTKTFEFFADEDNDPSDSTDGFSLLDSAEDFIPDQKVVVIKPDNPPHATSPFVDTSTCNSSSGQTRIFATLNTQVIQSLISSIFATLSSFEASYLHLQTAHVPFEEETVKTADRALVSHLHRLSDLKHFFRDYCKNPDFGYDLPLGSCLEGHVQENQSKLRALETVSNRLQAEIDQKDAHVSALKKQLNEIQKSNEKLSKKLSGNLDSSRDILLSVKVFDSVLHDACRETHKFSKVLIDLMRKAGWDLDLAANSVHPGIDYSKMGHNRYALLSYICLGMFREFGLKGYTLSDSELACNGHILDSGECNDPLMQLLEHVSSNPMELLSRRSNCEFSRFCENKYQALIHPTIETSIFSNLDKKEVILNSWRSVSTLYQSFVNMASSIWTLHKLAFSFDPVVEIFQVEKGVDFSIVYMEDVTRRSNFSSKALALAKVDFTVVPGFKIGRTVIQSQVYLSGLKCTE